MKRRSILLLALATALVATAAPPPTNIDPVEKYAWSENAGWINFRGDGLIGVVVAGHFLSGFAWCENVGWLFLGNGPNNGHSYTQAAGDTGVNNDGVGNLSGYAWGENIGWVVFDPAGSGQRVRIDGQGRFSGCAWGENIGWINMQSGYGVKSDVGFAPAASADNWRLYE